jgi:hypothetical protein
VLDVTGSMAQDGKMDALKPAAKSLIDQLAALAKKPGDVYASIIPFAKDVGASNHNASWIHWTTGTVTTSPADGRSLNPILRRAI